MTATVLGDGTLGLPPPDSMMVAPVSVQVLATANATSPALHVIRRSVNAAAIP